MFTRLSSLKSNLLTVKGQWASTTQTRVQGPSSLFPRTASHPFSFSSPLHTLPLTLSLPVQKTHPTTALSLTFKYPTATSTLYKYSPPLGKTYSTSPPPPAEPTSPTYQYNDEEYEKGVEVDRSVQLWLLFCTLLVFGIILIGGITRLTESGLSMTDWQFQGSLPPMSEEEWKEEFEKYKQYPEFRRLHSSMNLEEFKSIYFWEYLHRMWGRFIGVAFGVPYLYFAMRGKLKGINAQCGAILLGIGLQGLLGWWMVKSGLEEPTHDQHIPRVSQYRLAAHLTAALALYSGMLWTTLSVSTPKLTPDRFVPGVFSREALIRSLRTSRSLSALSTSLVFLTAITGAFVAGLDAGLVYNTFPLMGDTFVPEESWQVQQIPALPTSPYNASQLLSSDATKNWLRDNLFENSASVQFNHRVMAFTTTTAISYMFLRTMPLSVCSPKIVRFARNGVVLTLIMQVGLGITTLLTFVPTPIAVAHQGGSVLLLTANLCYLFLLRRFRIPI